MAVRAVIFDLGGVLVRTEDQDSRRRLAGRLGLTQDELYRLVFDNETARLATVGQVTTQEHWAAVQEALNLTPEEFPSVPAGFWGGDRLDAELVEAIRALRGRYRTALLSNAWDNLRELLEQEWRISDAFDEIVISAEVGLAKPDERIFHLLLERLGLAPGEAVFIDDVRENVDAARSVGMHAIQFLSRGQALSELERLLAEEKTKHEGHEED